MCGGYYQEPAIVYNYPNPAGFKEENTTITASQPSLFSQSGTSILRGNVTVTQPGRQIVANQAYLYRDKTGKISIIDLVGNVHIREAGKLVVANHARVNLKKKVATIENAVYRFTKTTATGVLNAWGKLKSGVRESTGILDLNHATYSTCPPDTRVWTVNAEHLHLDKASGRGTAINSYLDVKGVPVFYVPYFSFPLDNRRKSGFLFPTFGYTSNSGEQFSIPYYFNLAPNYDATVTPQLYGRRGLQGNLLFRYLTPDTYGVFSASVLPSDRLFRQFQQDAPTLYADVPDKKAYLSSLKNDSDTRTYLSYTNSSTFNKHWSSDLDLNYVTDAYYFQDLGSTPALATADQLLNQGDLRYQSTHWHFLGQLQAYQTLHQINQMAISNQYSHLPEFDLSGDYPDQAYGLDYALDTQFINFDQQNFFTNQTPVTGARLNVDPSISLPMGDASGYFIPKLQLDGTYYSLKNQPRRLPALTNQLTPLFPLTAQPSRLPDSISRNLPIFDIDSGLFFDRNLDFLHHSYQQTLEPQVFYLYVPNTNQSDIPIFDTALPPFSFAQMFQTNRFTGYDRVGDANQVTAALTSRFLDEYTGQEKLRASIGQIYYFEKHHTQCDRNPLLCTPDPTLNDKISPVVGELSYNLNPAWNVTSDLAWDPNRGRTDDGSVNFTYNWNRRIFNLGYYYVYNGDRLSDTSTGSVNDFNRFNIAAAVPVTQHWSVVGNWNYNISHGYPQTYFYGAQYDSCCWAARFVISRTIIAQDQFGNAQFNPAYYIQIQLKGLGNLGNSDPGALLTGALPGYQDIFN